MRTFGFFLLWVAGATAAVAVVWAGVSVVDDDLVMPAPARNQVLTAAQPGGDAPAPETPGSEATSGDLDDSSAAPTEPTTVTVAPAPTATIEPSPMSAPTPVAPDAPTTPAPTAIPPEPSPTSAPSVASPTPAPTAIPPEPSPTSAPSVASPTPAPSDPSPTPTLPPPTPTVDPSPAPAETITFNLLGGTTAVSFSASGVEVLWATPNPGFEVRIEPESPGMKVEFRADHHRSRIDVWWQAGPQYEIREEPDD